MNPYNHLATEKYWQKKWEMDMVYRTDTHSSKPVFFGLVEFPYPSGAGLHVGHVRSYTGMDVIVRKRRMEGFETLFPIGWDAFGLPAENYAIKTGIHPSITTRENIDTFREQLKSCGFSFDWDREVDTTDPKYYKWTQWIFLKLYEKGLAYKKEMPVNWCPKDKCVLANEEVVDGRCERCGTIVEKRNKEQWMLAITKYAERLDKDLDETDFLERIKIQQRNWIGMSDGSEIDFKVKSERDTKKKILIGTRNNAKFQMITACFPQDLNIEFINLDDIEVDDSTLVEGQDFEENAKLKSEFYFKATGIPTISTDHILWLEKWSKDKGYMIHLRKEANPDSDRATDEEVVAFLKKWLSEVGGQTPAHFEYAVSYTDANGSKGFVSLQRKYILQPVQSEKFWDGYPTESLLLDVETGEYKGDQKDDFRYAGLIKDLDTQFRKWLGVNDKFTVYTTRADTLFGCTYCVLAPEHSLVKQMLASGKIKNKDEVQKYVNEAVQKIDIDRSAEGKEKTGVKLEGVIAINPANKKEVPVFIADYVLATYGTGAIMAVPAHDERDNEFAKKYGIEIKKVIWSKAPIKSFLMGGKNISDEDLISIGITISGKNNDGDRKIILPKESISKYEKLITEKMESGFWNEYIFEEVVFIFKNKDGSIERFVLSDENEKIIDKKAAEFCGQELNKVGVWTWLSENGWYKDIIIQTSDGVLINSGVYNGLKSEEARIKITETVGGRLVKKSKLRDWVFARQRYWGEPIPLVYDKSGRLYPVHESELPVTLPQVDKFEPTDNGESPLYQVPEWVHVKGYIDDAGYFHAKEGGEEFRRETDTMPQWAGSSWYFMRYIDPKNDKEIGEREMLMKWLPVTWYNGGMEHTTLHLLYSRFWYKFLFDIGMTPTSEPYYRRTSQGMILGKGGIKMSKSIGNVVNPDEIVKKFGADTLRMYEMFIGPFDQAVAWDDKSVIGIRRFIDRVYAFREKINDTNKTLTITHKTIKKVGDDIETMAFNTAISSLMICLNEYEKEGSVSKNDFKMFVRLLAPFAPFLAEELWKSCGEIKSVHAQSWPKYDEKELISDTISYVLQVNGKLRGEINLSSESTKEEVLSAVKALEGYIKYVGNAVPKKEIFVPGKLVNIVI